MLEHEQPRFGLGPMVDAPSGLERHERLQVVAMIQGMGKCADVGMRSATKQAFSPPLSIRSTVIRTCPASERADSRQDLASPSIN